ncbi:hypothetical protein ACFRJ9_22600 [Paenarthrobacter sp. NPDC056912]|uniref:hypothetical protein n=1 Tax=Paenarthrobacter sp. NPDC056912 TaxID=3345965 RepID=UPI0036708A5D
MLLKRHVFDAGRKTDGLDRACQDVFDTRAINGAINGIETKTWPTEIVVHRSWGTDFTKLADDLGIDIDLATAVREVNDWLLHLRP